MGSTLRCWEGQAPREGLKALHPRPRASLLSDCPSAAVFLTNWLIVSQLFLWVLRAVPANG